MHILSNFHEALGLRLLYRENKLPNVHFPVLFITEQFLQFSQCAWQSCGMNQAEVIYGRNVKVFLSFCLVCAHRFSCSLQN